MVPAADALALERQLLDQYRNYPNIQSVNQTQYSNTNTSRLFQGGRNEDFLRRQILSNQELQKKVFGLDGIPEDGEANPKSQSHVIWWWEPPPQNIPTQFFADSSMHGLKYLSQPKRHLCERIFWLIFFCTGVAGAAYLISEMWGRYTANPVIVSFEPVDVDINRIAFPAVTICNMNKLRKSVANDIVADYNLDPDTSSGQKLYNARVLCDGQKSFANYFDFAYERGRVSTPDPTHYNSSLNSEVDPSTNQTQFEKFIQSETLDCDDFIRLCRWAGEAANCSILFKSIITEYGRCCTFNGLPDNLMQKGLEAETKEEKQEIKRWEKWAELGAFVLPTDWPNNSFPRTQARPGSIYGLSITLDSDVGEYFCPSSDSEGFRIMFHSPAELPPISEFGLSVGFGSEVYMKVIPEVIVADDEIKGYDKHKRQCMLRQEGNLEFYQHYTYSNCFDECITDAIISKCNCSFYYMPYVAKNRARACDANPFKDDYSCSTGVRQNMSQVLRANCSQCEALCSDITFRTETTLTKLQPGIWKDIDPTKMQSPPDWTSHEVSIVHIYYGDLSTVPKVRKALYGITDIIANIGGLLGLCLGFSILSAVEIVYFFTCRACLKKFGRGDKSDVESININQENPAGGTLRRLVFGFGRSDPNHLNRVISLDPNAVELRSQY